MTHAYRLVVLGVFIWTGYGCSPTVKLAPPDKPITINLNVKVEHEIRIKVDKELDEVIDKNSPLF